MIGHKSSLRYHALNCLAKKGQKMTEKQIESKSDAAVAWKWAQWPMFFGLFVGISLTKDVFDQVTKPHGFF
jgi:hypothetical protein